MLAVLEELSLVALNNRLVGFVRIVKIVQSNLVEQQRRCQEAQQDNVAFGLFHNSGKYNRRFHNCNLVAA